MEHIYNCEYLNIEEPIEKYEKIFIGNIYEQKRVLERFEKNMDIREILEESAHKIPFCDPPFSILFECGNG